MQKKVLPAILCICLILGMLLNGNHSEAKAQKKYYDTSLTRSSKDRIANIYKAKFSENKMIAWGTWRVSHSAKKLLSGKKLKSKKRTFILASNCKFYSSGGEYGKERISKAGMKEAVVHWMNGVDLIMTVRNGKVIKMNLAS